jgi:hypothetical protein
MAEEQEPSPEVSITMSTPAIPSSPGARPSGRRRRVLGVLALAAGALPAGLALAASSPSPAGAATTAPTSTTFDYQGGQSQTFTVPPAVTQVTITAFGGGGGLGQAFMGESETLAAGGAGGEISVGLGVTPGQTLTVDVGQAGQGAGQGQSGGGAGGNGSGDGMTGGTGGSGALPGVNPGGGGGAGTAVYETGQAGQPGQMVVGAGGGGGGGAAGNCSGCNGGVGGQGASPSDPGAAGNGANGVNADAQGDGDGGLFAQAFSASGGQGGAGGGNGGAGGGGGGGVFANGLGGGQGGFAGASSGGGGGGGGGGQSWAWSGTDTTPSYGAGTTGDGYVVISWQPSDQVALSAHPPSQVTAGQQATYTATVTTSGGAPTGTVTFRDNGAADCSDVPLTSTGPDLATATCSESYSQVGPHSITATYSGDGTFPASQAPPLNEAVVPPTTYYVAVDGTDTANTTCTEAAPCATIDHAESLAAPGDVVSVGPGTFVGNVDVTIPLTLSGSGPSTLISAPSGADAIDVSANATIQDLSATSSSDHDVTVDSGDVTVSNVDLTGGLTGLVVNGGNAEFSGGRISAADAGAITSAELELDNATVTANTAVEAAANPGGSLVVLSSTLGGATDTNGAQFGSGIAINGGTLFLTDSTVTANKGGGLNLEGSALATVERSTVAGNGGPGISQSQSTAFVSGTVLARNSGGDCSGVVNDAHYNLSDDTTCGFSSTNGDLVGVHPKLGPLAQNGGPTETEAPASTSRVVDAIPLNAQSQQPASNPLCLSGTDQRGVARPQPAGGACDMGAVELAPAKATLKAKPNPSVEGQRVTLKAKVTDGLKKPTLPSPTGTVTFSRGPAALPGCSAVPLTAGKATCSTALTIGGLSPTVTYHGTNGYRSATATLSHTLTRAATHTTLTVSANPAQTGKPVTYRAAVKVLSPGSGIPQGTVAFRIDGQAVPGCHQVPLGPGGRARCTKTFAVSGARTVTASYPGTVGYSGSAGAILQHVHG